MIKIRWPWAKKTKPAEKEDAELVADPEEESDEIEGERGLPSVNKSRSIQGRIVRLMIGGCIIFIVVLALGRHYMGIYDNYKKEKKDSEVKAGPASSQNSATNTIPFPMLPPPEAAPPEAYAAANKSSIDPKTGLATVPKLVMNGNAGGGAPEYMNGTPQDGQQGYKAPEEIEMEKRLKSSLKNEKETGNANMGAVRPASYNAEASSGGGGDSLQGMNTPTARATLIPDRNLMVAKGSFLDCTLDTELDSSLGGMASCTLARDIYSDNGMVILMEKGTVCSGEYRGDMKPGQARLFVLWTRAKTPRGVTVDLSSAGTDRLGRAGVEGYVDNHFWDRFGAAIMMTVIQQGASVLQNRSSGGGNIINQTNPAIQDSQSLVMEMVKPAADLPATLKKHRGERVSIYLARDLDFRGVYSLEKMDYKK